MSTTESKSGGSTVLGLLGVAFVVLKLCHVVAWSWLWVLAPFWIPLSFAAVIFVVIGLIALIGLVKS